MSGGGQRCCDGNKGCWKWSGICRNRLDNMMTIENQNMKEYFYLFCAVMLCPWVILIGCTELCKSQSCIARSEWGTMLWEISIGNNESVATIAPSFTLPSAAQTPTNPAIHNHPYISRISYSHFASLLGVVKTATAVGDGVIEGTKVGHKNFLISHRDNFILLSSRLSEVA